MELQNILRRRDVQKVTGLSRSQIYKLMSQDQFPRPIPLCGRAVGWLENEVQEWQKARIAERVTQPVTPADDTTEAASVSTAAGVTP